MVVDGMATALPFHRLIVRDPAFVDEPFRVHTRWIETEWSTTPSPPYAGAAAGRRRRPRSGATVVVEVGGKRLEVSLPGGARRGTGAAAGPRGRRRSGRRGKGQAPAPRPATR